MPGYLTQPSTSAIGVANVPSGNISASNVQAAINELDTEKAPSSGIAQSAITNLVSDLSAKAPLNSPNFTGTLSASVANISSNLIVDTNTFFVDSINNRVGVGTISPSTILNVVGGDIIVSDASQTNFSQLGSDGNLELHKSNSSSYIDFKTTNAEDFDCRIQQNDNGLSFQTGGQGATAERARIDSSGRLILSNQPAFFAQSTVGWQTTNAGSVITFNVATFNRSSNYNTSNGAFTAPVAGMYFFYFQFYTGSLTSIAIYKNGSVFVPGDAAIGFKNISGDETRNASIIMSLAVNDYVQIGVRPGAGSMYWYGGHSWFMGNFLG